MWPTGRTTDYAIWRACERLSVRPPGVKDDWDECSVWTQAKILAYNQVRERDEMELLKAQTGGGKSSGESRSFKKPKRRR